MGGKNQCSKYLDLSVPIKTTIASLCKLGLGRMSRRLSVQPRHISVIWVFSCIRRITLAALNASRSPADNCAGLVWASRRAILPNPGEWEVLLKEDGYRQVSDSEVAVGDIAVYRSNSDGTIIHVGRVCLFDKLLLGGGISTDGPRVPMVIGKLGPTMGEVIHRKDHITIDGGSDFASAFYTDR